MVKFMLIISTTVLGCFSAFADSYSCSLSVNEQSATKSVELAKEKSAAQRMETEITAIQEFGPILLNDYKCLGSAEESRDGFQFTLEVYDTRTTPKKIVHSETKKMKAALSHLEISAKASGRKQENIYCRCELVKSE